MVRDLLVNLGQGIEVEIKEITTSGDWRPEHGERRLDALRGGKALFAKEIEEALLEGVVDIGVHCMKDMETKLPDGLCIPYMLPREDVRDVFLSDNVRNFFHLPTGATVGTTSIRRQAFILRHRPDIKVVPFRGNVQTRIAKLRAGQVDATLLASAGMRRLGLEHEGMSKLDTEMMLPAVGQGAIGIEIRESDRKKLSFISQISCLKTYLCTVCERAVLRALGGSCLTPVGTYAIFNGDTSEMLLRTRVLSPDGQESWARNACGDVTTEAEAEALGEAVGLYLRDVVPRDIINLTHA